MSKLYNTFGLAAIIGIFLSIGSLGAFMNWSDPHWAEFGIRPAELRASIKSFPQNHCGPSVRPACEHLSSGALWFLGL